MKSGKGATTRAPVGANKQANIQDNTHSVSAAINGDSRLTSLTHPYWNVSLRMGEPHVDHCKESTGVFYMLEQNKDRDNDN